MADERKDSRQSKSLSKNVLKMKFMQRTEEAKLRHKLEEEEKREIDEAHWVLDNGYGVEDDNFIEFEPSYAVCEGLVPTGRMSFRKFNPAIEKLFHELVVEKELAECGEREKQDTVSDEQMAERYDTLIDTVGKKFAGKRKRHNHDKEPDMDFEPVKASKKQKPGFRKPKDD